MNKIEANVWCPCELEEDTHDILSLITKMLEDIKKEFSSSNNIITDIILMEQNEYKKKYTYLIKITDIILKEYIELYFVFKKAGESLMVGMIDEGDETKTANYMCILMSICKFFNSNLQLLETKKFN